MVKIKRATIRDMANPRLVIATALAGVAFAIAVFGMIGENSMSVTQMEMAGHASLAASHFGGLSASHVPGLIALGLSAAALTDTPCQSTSCMILALQFTPVAFLFCSRSCPMRVAGPIEFPRPDSRRNARYSSIGLKMLPY